MRRILAAGVGILVISVPAIAASALMQDQTSIDANDADASEDVVQNDVVRNEADGCETGNMTMDAYRERCADGIYGNPATWNTPSAHDEAEPNMADEAPPAEPER